MISTESYTKTKPLTSSESVFRQKSFTFTVVSFKNLITNRHI